VLSQVTKTRDLTGKMKSFIKIDKEFEQQQKCGLLGKRKEDIDQKLLQSTEISGS